MPTPRSTAGMYPGKQIVGEDGWWEHDGTDILSFGHRRATAAQMLALFDQPDNLSEAQAKAWKDNADAILTWEFCAAQMRLYNHYFDSTHKRQPILNTLRSHVRFGKCNEVPQVLVQKERELKAEWDAKYGNPVNQAPTASQLSDGAAATTEVQDTGVGESAATAPEVEDTLIEEDTGSTIEVKDDAPDAPNSALEDDEPVLHQVLPGQGLTASRWHIPSSEPDQRPSATNLQRLSTNKQGKMAGITAVEGKMEVEMGPSNTAVENAMEVEKEPTTTSAEIIPAAMEVGDNDQTAINSKTGPDAIVHQVTAGKGMGASRWNDPVTEPKTGSNTVEGKQAQTATVVNNNNPGSNGQEAEAPKPASVQTTHSQGLNAARRNAPVKGLAASRHNPDRH